MIHTVYLSETEFEIIRQLIIRRDATKLEEDVEIEADEGLFNFNLDEYQEATSDLEDLFNISPVDFASC